MQSLQPSTPTGNNDPLPAVVAAFVENIQGVLKNADNKGNRNSLAALSWSEQTVSSVKGVTVKETMITLVNEEKLWSGKKLYDVEPSWLDTKNRGHYWAVMELVESVMTLEQQQLFQLKKKEREQVEYFDDILKMTAYNLEDMAFKRMDELDGKTSSTLRRTISGMGNRYSKYCEQHNIRRMKVGVNSSLPASALAGNSGIRDFFGRVVNALSPGRRS